MEQSFHAEATGGTATMVVPTSSDDSATAAAPPPLLESRVTRDAAAAVMASREPSLVLSCHRSIKEQRGSDGDSFFFFCISYG